MTPSIRDAFIRLQPQGRMDSMDPLDKPIRDPEILARAQLTFDLCEAAEQIMRQNIRRRSPELSDEEVEERIVEWYRRRPEDGNFGRPSKKWAARFGLRP